MDNKVRLAIFFGFGILFLIVGGALWSVDQSRETVRNAIAVVLLGGILVTLGLFVVRDMRLADEGRKGV